MIFYKKDKREEMPFGEVPKRKKGGGFIVTPRTNPFEILLNYDGGYHGREKMPRLSRLIQDFWASHSPVIEVVFLWQNSFNCTVINEDGQIE